MSLVRASHLQSFKPGHCDAWVLLVQLVEHGLQLLEAEAHPTRDGLARVAREEQGIRVGLQTQDGALNKSNTLILGELRAAAVLCL